jgi:hypothetical protein
MIAICLGNFLIVLIANFNQFFTLIFIIGMASGGYLVTNMVVDYFIYPIKFVLGFTCRNFAQFQISFVGCLIEWMATWNVRNRIVGLCIKGLANVPFGYCHSFGHIFHHNCAFIEHGMGHLPLGHFHFNSDFDDSSAANKPIRMILNAFNSLKFWYPNGN